MPKIPFGVNPVVSLDMLQDEVGHLFHRLWHGGINTPPLDGQDWAPAIELRDEAARFEVIAELPGVDSQAMDITVENNVLIIRGEKLSGPTTDSPANSGSKVLRSERRYGSFRRTVELPAPIRPDDVSATFDNGILTVSLPKTEQASSPTVRIPIKPG